MVDTIIPTPDEGEIDLEGFRMMVDIRAKALELAQKMPHTQRIASIFEKAEEIEAWLTRKS